jgi:GNAT superfamily N-acetyltransferase
MSDAVSVRWARPDDAASLASLIHQLHVHYGQPSAKAEDCLAEASLWLAGEPGMARAALAFQGSDCCGLAVTSRLWPAEGIASALLIKVLFVSEPSRGQGIGKRILRFLAQHCAAEGIARMDLTTEDWNEGAIRFYERNGAKVQTRKIYLRFDRTAIGTLGDDARNR